jgi:cell division protein FtsB
MSAPKTSIDYSKAFTWLLGITLAFFSWFGKVAYEKLNSIDTKVEALLVQNGIQKTEIDNLKEQIKGMNPCKNNTEKTVSVIHQEAILPDRTELKKKYSLASK